MRCRAALFVVGLLGAFTAAAADDLTIAGPADPLSLGVPSQELRVQRIGAAGSIDPSASEVIVTLTSSSEFGQFSSNGSSFTNALSVVILAGARESAPFTYRDGRVGTHVLKASAIGYRTLGREVLVRPLSVGDDFETGLLDQSEGGRWIVEKFDSGTAPTLAASSARRGRYGLRIDDPISVQGGGPESRIIYRLAPIAGSYFVRFWVRVSARNPVGLVQLATVRNGFTGFAAAFSGLRFDSRRFSCGGWDVRGTRGEVELDADAPDDAWRLVELAVEGVGTPAATRRAWVDGAPLASTELDLSGAEQHLRLFYLGNVYAGDRTFTGTLDFDDVRTGALPHASRVTVVPASARFTVRDCIPVQVALLASTGARAEAPYRVVAPLTSSQGGFFSDPLCTTGVSSATIESGAPHSDLYFQATATGEAALGARFVDFLQEDVTLSVGPGSDLTLSPRAANVNSSQKVSITVTGGRGPYAFRIATNASKSSLSPASASSAEYTAGSSGPAVDVIEVTDAAGATATSNLVVAAAPSLSPSLVTVRPRGTQQFSASGGKPPYDFTLSRAASGGFITPAGLYTAGPTPSVSDLVTVRDSVGSIASATVQIGAPPLEPRSLRITTRGALPVQLCGEVNLIVSAIDDYGEEVAFNEPIQICIDPLASATLVRTSLANPTLAQGCVIGALDAQGKTDVTWTNARAETVTVRALAASLPRAADPLVVEWDEATGSECPKVAVPIFRSEPATTATCGEPYRYADARDGPSVEGTGPLRYLIRATDSSEMAAPSLAIDSETGAIDWTPTELDVGLHRLELIAAGPGGSTTQRFEVAVTCPARSWLGCSSASEGARSGWLFLGWLGLVVVARRALRFLRRS